MRRILPLGTLVLSLLAPLCSATADQPGMPERVKALEDARRATQLQIAKMRHRISRVESTVGGLETRLMALEATDPVPGTPGPQGRPGEQGPQGEVGPAGPPGEGLTAELLAQIDAIESALLVVENGVNAARGEVNCRQPIPGEPYEDRFVDHGDGTVADVCTGLMWTKGTVDVDGDGEIVYQADRVPFEELPGILAALQLGGHTDWRVPTIDELANLIATGLVPPSFDPGLVDPDVSPGENAGEYWSQTAAFTSQGVDYVSVISFGSPPRWGIQPTTGQPGERGRALLRAVREP